MNEKKKKAQKNEDKDKLNTEMVFVKSSSNNVNMSTSLNTIMYNNE
jgi:hypothetical protein